MQIYKIYVTEQAFKIIDLTLSKRSLPKILRIGIRGGHGCAGFKYYIECAEYVSEHGDVRFHYENNICIVIDKKSMRHLNRCILHWVDTNKEKGLKLINPNEKTKCRCGKSFAV